MNSIEKKKENHTNCKRNKLQNSGVKYYVAVARVTLALSMNHMASFEKIIAMTRKNRIHSIE